MHAMDATMAAYDVADIWLVSEAVATPRDPPPQWPTSQLPETRPGLPRSNWC